MFVAIMRKSFKEYLKHKHHQREHIHPVSENSSKSDFGLSFHI